MSIGSTEEECLKSRIWKGLDKKIKELRSGRSMGVKDSRSVPDCGEVTEVVIVIQGVYQVVGVLQR